MHFYNCKTEHLKTELITEKSALKGLIYKNQEIESVSYNVQCTATMEHVTWGTIPASQIRKIQYNHDLAVTHLTILRVQPILYYVKLFYFSELWKYLSNTVSLLPSNSTDSWKLWRLNVNHNALFTLISNGIFRNLARQKPVTN